MSVSGSANTVAQPPRGIDEHWYLKEKICINEDCNHRMERNEERCNFCPYCGSKLEDHLKDIFIEIHDYEYDPIPPNVRDEPSLVAPDKSRGRRISLREFVKIFRKYEKEVFVESL